MLKKICQIVKEISGTQKRVTRNSKFREISLDSISYVMLLTEIETEFGVEFEAEELNIDDYENVSDLYNKVLEKDNERNG